MIMSMIMRTLGVLSGMSGMSGMSALAVVGGRSPTGAWAVMGEVRQDDDRVVRELGQA